MADDSTGSNIETVAVHAGRQVDPLTGAVSPSIQPSTTFRHPPDGSGDGYLYSRYASPNRDALERALTALETGADAAAFSSGMAAANAVLQTLKPGAHVLVTHDAYHGTLSLLDEVMAHWGLAYTGVDTCDIDAVRAARRPETRLLWVETPSNPMLRIADLATLGTWAAQNGIASVCDNTFATPILQRPLTLGFDLCLHSTTKYVGGHSDVLGGALVTREYSPLWEAVRSVQRRAGAVPGAFDAWLLLRGVATLPLRVRAQCAGAQRLAEALADHPQVSRVHYPGLPTHPGHTLAAKQMTAFGAVVSFEVAGGEAAALRAAANVELLTCATSLGGVESLIEHRASVEGPDSATPRNLLRVSVGIEHPDDLIADINRALTA